MVGPIDRGEQMKRFLVLVPWVAAGILVLALTPAGSAAAGTAQGRGTHLAPSHVINLHRAFEARLRHATAQGQIAGIVYPVGGGPLRGRGGNNCAEPYCPVVYQGGSVQHTPDVYLLLWGPNWSSDPNQAATATYLESFYSGLGVPPQDNWSTVTSQYGDSSGFPTFNGVYKGVFQDLNTPPTGVGQQGLAAEADTFAVNQGISDLGDAQIVVATQSGTCPAGFAGTGCAGSNNYYCAWHSVSNEPYTNLPYLLDAGTACGENFVNTSGTHDGFSIVGSGEYADTITDPDPTTGWYDFFDQGNFGEIADKCAWDTHSHDVALSSGNFAMQPLWSNNDDGCVMPVGGQSDTVTVANPGDQSTYQNSALILHVSGTSSGQHPLMWSATGLPAGLTIDSGTGVISGQITVAPGTYPVIVQASDPTRAFDWKAFNWTVLKDVGTTVTNKASGTCLNDRGESISPGNAVQMWKCIVSAPEMFSQPTNAGELIVLGQCLTDPNGALHGGAGTLQVVEPCTPGAANQQWFHNSKNEYVLGSNFLCLTDQNGNKTLGAPTKVEKCTGATDQQWSGPQVRGNR
jgi:hypothetical protein